MTRSALPTLPAAATGNAEPVHGMGTNNQRREAVGNLSAGAWCPGPIEGLTE